MRKILAVVIGTVAVFLVVGPAAATPVTVDQIIYQNGTGVNPALISGTIDITVSGLQQLTIDIKNTSANNAFTDSTHPALMLLTGFGIQLPAGSGIITAGSTVSVASGSTAVNFDVGQNATNISNQWLYANSSIDGYNLAGALAVNAITSSVNNGAGTRFAGPPPNNINGPGYGAISANETQFGHSTPGVKDTIELVLNLAGPAPTVAQIDAGNVVLAFGSPDTVGGGGGGSTQVPEPGTVMLLGSALLGVAGLSTTRARRWWHKK